MCLFYLVFNCLAEHGILVQKFLSFRFPSMTPTFTCRAPGTCPLILLSHLSYFMPLHLFALLSGGFGELYCVMILLSFFLSHFNFWELFYVLWMLGFFFFFFLNWLFSFHSCNISFYRWDICSAFICHVLFPPCMGPIFSKPFFLLCLFLSYFLCGKAVHSWLNAHRKKHCNLDT